jgi:hypothetical protein
LPEKPKSLTYFFFYILFHPDPYRILFGFLAAILLAPQIVPPDLSAAGRAMIYVMIATIVWALSARPAAWITGALKKWLLGEGPKK